MTPVYYLESGQVKFWQQSSSTSSATLITPNAIVAKKQSLVSVSYDPYKKQTVVAVYKGEAEVADLATGKKMLLKPTDEGKPRIAVIALASSSPAQETKTALPVSKQSSYEPNIGILIAVVVMVLVIGYIIVKRRTYISSMFNRFKTKLSNKNTNKKSDE